MNWLDVVLLVILAASVLTSFRKGLSREVIKLAAVVAGLVLGVWFYATVAGWLSPYVTSHMAANFAGFLIVFFAVMLVGAIVSGIVGRFLRVTGLGFVDHALGAAFGVVRGVLICVGVIMAIMAFAPEHKAPQAVVDSRLAPHIAVASQAIVAVAPKELKDGFQETYSQVKDAWNHVVVDTKGTHTLPVGEKRK